MALVRWEPVTFPSEMNRLLTSFFDTPTTGARRWNPAFDLVETEAHLMLRADLPGLTLDDVHVTVEDGVLTVAGERRTAPGEGATALRAERTGGAFSRSLRLPRDVDPEGIEAALEVGVLEIRIAKPAAPRPVQIPISVGAPERRDIEATATA